MTEITPVLQTHCSDAEVEAHVVRAIPRGLCAEPLEQLDGTT